MNNYADIPEWELAKKAETVRLGAHCLRVKTGPITLWYSYGTIVAFRCRLLDNNLIVCENAWGVTTGKHLNWIDNGDKRNRLPRYQFTDLLIWALTQLGLEE